MEVKTHGTPIENSQSPNNEDVSFWDVMPYPSVLISLIVGVLSWVLLSSSYYNVRYGEVITSIPAYEEAKKNAETNTLEIKRLVKENEEYAKTINDNADKVIEWGKNMKIGWEKVVSTN